MDCCNLATHLRDCCHKAILTGDFNWDRYAE